jgi:hypothetical protein
MDADEFGIRVCDLYSAFGYAVKRNVALTGHQVPLLCEKHLDGYQIARLLIECVFRETGPVILTEINQFLILAVELISTGVVSGATLVTNSSYSREVEQRVRAYPQIALKTLLDLQDELLNFTHVYETAITDYEHDEIFSIYVSASAVGADPRLNAPNADPIDRILLDRAIANKPSTSIVLADFGGGKTTLLKRVFYEMAKTALVNMQTRRPVFVELKNFHRYASIKDFFFS